MLKQQKALNTSKDLKKGKGGERDSPKDLSSSRFRMLQQILKLCMTMEFEGHRWSSCCWYSSINCRKLLIMWLFCKSTFSILMKLDIFRDECHHVGLFQITRRRQCHIPEAFKDRLALPLGGNYDMLLRKKLLIYHSPNHMAPKDHWRVLCETSI